MISASSDLAARFSTFEGEAFRLVLDDYSNSGNPAACQTFLAGEAKPADHNAAWLDTVRRATESGKRMVRVHILSCPLTPYLRHELGWGYLTNMTAGEEFHILDVTDRPNPCKACRTSGSSTAASGSSSTTTRTAPSPAPSSYRQ